MTRPKGAATLLRENKKLRKWLFAMPEEPFKKTIGYKYTDWCTGADGTGKQPYQRQRNRQCSIGYHEECSHASGGPCGCPCHVFGAP